MTTFDINFRELEKEEVTVEILDFMKNTKSLPKSKLINLSK